MAARRGARPAGSGEITGLGKSRGGDIVRSIGASVTGKNGGIAGNGVGDTPKDATDGAVAFVDWSACCPPVTDKRKCPLCGGQLPDGVRLPIDDPIFDNDAHYVIVDDKRRPLARMPWLMLLELRRSFPRACSRERLLEATARDHVDERLLSNVTVRMSECRRVLRGTRYAIVPMPVDGYRLVIIGA